MSKNNNNNNNRPVVENTEVIKESVKVMNEVETPVVKEAPIDPKAPEVKETPVVKEEVKPEVKEAPVQPAREEVKVVDGLIINGHAIPVEDHKKEKSHNVFIEDIKPIIPLGGVKGPLSIKLTESVIKHVLSFGYRVATLNEDGSRFYVHKDANGELKVKK